MEGKKKNFSNIIHSNLKKLGRRPLRNGTDSTTKTLVNLAHILISEFGKEVSEQLL